MEVLRWLLLFSICFQSAIGGNVLVWETLGATSHMLAIDPLVRGLAQNNHSVIYVAYNVPKWLGEEKNVEFVHVGMDMSKMINEQMDIFNFNPFNMSFIPDDFGTKTQKECFEHPRIQELIHNPIKFDLTIISTAAVDIGLYLSKKVFQSPTIFFSAGFTDPLTHSSFGNPINPSYIGNEMVDLSSRMSFMERVENVLSVVFLWTFGVWHLYKLECDLGKFFPDDKNIDLRELQANTDMLFINQHPLFDKAKPINPNTVMVGGIHIEDRPKPLPKDIKDWLDNAEHGVVYISLGSVTKGSTLPVEKREAILKAFAGLKERVLWKWETEVMSDKPPNVMLKKWCPQQQILAHPKVKLFISHGGLLSTYESVYFATPLFVIPGFGDQFSNAHFVKDHKIGTSTRWSELNEESFNFLLHSVLNNAAVARRVQEYSALFRDEPMRPLDKALFYAEYLMRHKDAQHLQPSSKQLYWFQYLLLDIGLFAVAMVTLAVSVMGIAGKWLLRRCSASTTKHQKKE